jgi:hypothetical protein
MVMHQMSLYAMTVVMRCLPEDRRTAFMPGLGLQWTWFSWLRTFIPIGFFQGAALALGNVALVTGTVHMALMIKALKPVLCYLLTLMLCRDSLSVSRVKILGMVSVGCIVTIEGDLSTSFAGIVTCLFSTSTDSLRLILTQGSMQDRKLDVFTTLAYISPVSVCFVTPIAFLYEWDSLRSRSYRPGDGLAIGMSCVVAVALNIVSNMVLSRTSAVTLALAGIAKDFVVIIISSWLFSSAISMVQMGGYTLAMFSMHVYSECSKNIDMFERDGVFLALWTLMSGADSNTELGGTKQPELAGFSRVEANEDPAE